LRVEADKRGVRSTETSLGKRNFLGRKSFRKKGKSQRRGKLWERGRDGEKRLEKREGELSKTP